MKTIFRGYSGREKGRNLSLKMGSGHNFKVIFSGSEASLDDEGEIYGVLGTVELVCRRDGHVVGSALAGAT